MTHRVADQKFPMLALGKAPARPDAVKLKLSNYLNTSVFPTPPDSFGHEYTVPNWGMLGNDSVGDCVFAGAAHETKAWNASVKKNILFSDQSVLSDYSAVTGYTPTDPNTDQGTDMEQAAKYRRTTGVLDATGNRHRISAYIALTPGSLPELWAAMWMFEAVGIGVKFPRSAMDQFHQGKPWDPVPDSPIEGGHYICGLGRRKVKKLFRWQDRIKIVTWGFVTELTTQFYQDFNDESFAYLTDENLSISSGKTLEGFDIATLRQDLAKVISL